MKNLILRSLSGVVYVALIVGALVAGQSWATALFSIFCVLAMLEFQRITMGAPTDGWQVAARAVDIIVALCMCNVAYILDFPEILGISCIGILFGYGLLRFILALYSHGKNALADVAWSVLSISYIAVPMTLVNILCSEQDGWKIVLTMFVMIWLNDTGAYCVGSLCGRTPLFPRLSPKKSWEGLVGGLVFCIIAGACAYILVGQPFTLIEWMALGGVVCVLSTWGDLFESLIKRTHKIKDSGNIIPGHGGILDRIDSLLFTSVGVFVIMFIVDMV